MNMTSTELPEAPEYRLAGLLIKHLAEDSTLAPYVYPEPWDREDQCQGLAMAAQQYSGVVAVLPQPPGLLPADSQAKTGTLAARLVVVVLTTENLHPDRGARQAAGLFYKLINAVMQWDPQSAGIPYALPQVEAIAELDTSKITGLENLTGRDLTLSIPYNYKQKIKQ